MGKIDNDLVYKTIVENMPDGAYYVDTDRVIQYWNHAAEQMTGYKREEIIGKNCQATGLNHIDEKGRPLCSLGCPLFATNVDGKERHERVYVRHKDGHRFPIMVNIYPIIQDHEILGSIEIFTQDSPVKYDDNLVEKLSNVAMHDELTKLPNRIYLESFLEYKIHQLNKFGKNYCVVFADIDHFRDFNNNYGHDVGDLVLINIAKTLKHSMRKNDLVGRWGGEEFVGVFEIDKSYEVPIIAEKMRRAVEATDIAYKDSSLSVTISVGATQVTRKDTAEDVIKRADTNMYISKTGGRNRVTTD